MTLCFRYQLPFKPPLHHKKSPHVIELPPDDDPLTSGSLAEMLKFAWNIAWHDGIDKLVASFSQLGSSEDIECVLLKDKNNLKY